MRLPEEFKSRMKEELLSSGITEDGFFESFDEEPMKGIRINHLKVSSDRYESILNNMAPDEVPSVIPWCDCGFYTRHESSGNSPYYHSGVIYPQEPSAMLPAQVLSARPGDVVIDLCAAPGGKACRIAEDLNGEGVLIANEISEGRAKALLRNIERMGVKNAVVLNEDPVNMRPILKSIADKIIVDAPCSGEGMFRRDPAATGSWQKYGPDSCSELQRTILESADIMLRKGGELVYSTCTFGIKEDEDQIINFINEHPEYEVIPHPEIKGITHAPEGSRLPGSMRIWPHLSNGDGHFCVHLRKGSSDENIREQLELYKSGKPGRNTKETDAVLRFMSELLTDEAFAKFKERAYSGLEIRGGHVMMPAVSSRALGKLNIVKNGLYIGELKAKGKEIVLVPSNSLALTFGISELKPESVIIYKYGDPDLIRYLKGETIISDPGKKGTVVIAVDGFCLGFGKRSPDGMIKNMYPKAWRLL